MKKLRNFIMLALLVGFATSCDDIEQPFPQWDDPSVKYGAYARLLDGPNGELNLFNPAGSVIDFEVEFYDENKGLNVASYAWKVTFIDRATSGAKNKTADLLSVPASSFKTSESGLPGTEISFSFQDVLNALGFTINDVQGGDGFRFDATITKTDGTTFDNSNTDAILIAQFPYSALVRFTKNIVCLFDDPTVFTGEYTLTETTPIGPNGSIFGNDVTVTLTGESNTKRSFQATYLPDLALGNGPRSFSVDLVCGTVLVSTGQTAGLSCGGVNITIGPDPNNVGTFDAADDSTLTISFLDDSGSACDTPVPVTITLTKN